MEIHTTNGKVYLKNVPISIADEGGWSIDRDSLATTLAKFMSQIVHQRKCGFGELVVDKETIDPKEVFLPNASHLVTNVWTDGNVVWCDLRLIPSKRGSQLIGQVSRGSDLEEFQARMCLHGKQRLSTRIFEATSLMQIYLTNSPKQAQS